MKECRCIALDLDGTLLAGDGTLSKESREALTAAIEAGVHVVVASGRAYSTLPGAILSIPGIEYAITSNGAAVYRVPTSECICVHKLRREAVEDVLSLVGEAVEDPLYEAFVDGTAYAPAEYVADPEAFGADERAALYVKATRKPCRDMLDFLNSHLEELDSLDLIVNDQQEKRRIWALLEKNVPHVYITASVPRFLEISDEASGKASALAFVLERLGLSPEQAAAFGNADNDADMLAYAGLGIAVENATEACRAAADRIGASNDEDGAAREIRRILAETARGL